MDIIKKIKDKANAMKTKAESDFLCFKAWCNENPESARTLIGTAIISAGAVIVEIAKTANKVSECRSIECDVYDPRTGDHWTSKRPLTNKEKLELERRYGNGERKGDVLNDMRMLK